MDGKTERHESSSYNVSKINPTAFLGAWLASHKQILE